MSDHPHILPNIPKSQGALAAQRTALPYEPVCAMFRRYLHGEKPNPEFVLNFPRYQGASVLLTRANFGCGSSREHAPWGVKDYGFRVILAPVCISRSRRRWGSPPLANSTSAYWP